MSSNKDSFGPNFNNRLFASFEQKLSKEKVLRSNVQGEIIDFREYSLNDHELTVARTVLNFSGIVEPDSIFLVWESDYPTITRGDYITPSEESVTAGLVYAEGTINYGLYRSDEGDIRRHCSFLEEPEYDYLEPEVFIADMRNNQPAELVYAALGRVVEEITSRKN